NQPIKTIVVLVLENRSFDHMIGWMKDSINPKINGVTGKECNPDSTKARNGSVCFTDGAEFVDPDPGHSFEAVEQQVFGSGSVPSMSGFVEQALSMSQNLSQTVMKGFKPDNVPVYAALVREFAVFDRWFSSIPGPTQPNRLFVYSASSHGSTSHVKKQLAKGYPQQTIFDSLHDNGMNFAYLNFFDPQLSWDIVDIFLPMSAVISSPKGPASSSEFEHSSIPATIKKMYNLSSNFLTHRDAWAGTFEQVVGELTSPRTDCPEVLPDAAPLRRAEADENRGLSEFQSDVVQLAAVLTGDHFLSSFPDEMSKKMTVKEAHNYVRGALSRFITASKEAINLGADESAIVDMRSSLTTRSSIHP
ncbi:hypothetical protein RJ639_002480, partial [Escallonia herrerae]